MPLRYATYTQCGWAYDEAAARRPCDRHAAVLCAWYIGYSTGLPVLREQTWTPWDQVVVARAAANLEALVEQLEIAWVDGHGLVGIVANQVPVADVVGPGGAAVGFAGKGIAFRCGIRRPRTTETGCGIRAEVPPVGADRLDDHEVLVLSLERVDLNSLEQVVRGPAHDGCI